jgi:tetratricopeptide (TPR) repeat protein
MSDASPFQDLQQRLATGGAAGLFEQLIQTLRDRKDYHHIFDARLLKKKQELGLPLSRPTSFDDVPPHLKDEFEKVYADAAREAGELLLKDGKLSQAWMYFHAIRETEPIAKAIADFPIPHEGASQESEEIIDLALFKGLAPAKGVEIMLRTHGTCSTITSLDQGFAQLKPDDRAKCAAILVKSLHRDLLHSVQHDVSKRMPFAPPAKTLRELVAGREWLFADNNYHIDVSHLHATVRFARALLPESPELELARDLTEYGVHLSPQFQYAGDPPFEEFYPAHREFFRFLQNDGRDEALAYFQRKLDHEPDEANKPMIAYVLVDLLIRVKRYDDAIPLAETYLVTADESFADNFAEMCREAGRYDVLLRVAERRGDLVGYASALLQQKG